MARILVVEDNPQNLKLTTIILRSAGHTVRGAMDADAAEAAIAREIPDLIVMDVALPGRDGYTLTRELRHRPQTSRLPILALSAFAMPGDAEKALKAGCTDYLTKPVRRGPLLERVHRLLGFPGTKPAASDGQVASDPPPAAEARSSDSPAPPSTPAITIEPTEAPVSPAGPSDPRSPNDDTSQAFGVPTSGSAARGGA